MKPLLAGARVLDLTRALAGPYGSLLMGDLGAEVIKIEEKKGDATRGSRPRLPSGEGSYFVSVNRSKMSLTLDLTKPEGKAVFSDLVRVSDVVYDNYRPAALKKLKCDYVSVKKINPQIISCSVSGYGHTGALQNEPSFDLVVQALAGSMSITGESGRPPVRMGIPMGDLAGGMFAALAISAALYQRSLTGVGSEIDISLLDAQISLMTYLAQMYFTTGEIPGPQGSGHETIPVYAAFQTADGYVAVTSPGDRFWPKVCRAVELEELIDDPRCHGRLAQSEHMEEIRAMFQAQFIKKPTMGWLRILAEADVPAAPIQSLDQALAHPQVLERNMVVDVHYPPGGGPIKMLGNPVKLVGLTEEKFRPPPLLGEHNQIVLGDILGYGTARITHLRDAEIIT